MKLFLLLVFVALSVRFFIFDFFVVSNSEMLPTLVQNDYIGVQKYSYPPHSQKISRGDVVFIQSPDSVIRRIIGQPGDRIFYSEGVLYINEKSYRLRPPEGSLKREKEFLRVQDFKGENLSSNGSLDLNDYEHWQIDLENISHSVFLKKGSSLTFGPYVVPEDHYFVMGDHLTASRDSRTWATQGQKAQGEVIFLRNKMNSIEEILIPKGMSIKVDEDPYLPLFFETLHDVVLKEEAVKVLVQSQNQGLRGNIQKGKVWKVPLEFQDILTVRNDEDFFGGQDKSVVPLKDIKGKVVVVLWGCEKRVEFFYFLCQFNSFRKGRFFWRVHKKNL